MVNQIVKQKHLEILFTTSTKLKMRNKLNIANSCVTFSLETSFITLANLS